MKKETALLTKREEEILELVLEEFSNQEIADKLFISKRTVEAHKRNLILKTNSKSIIGVVLYTMREQLLT